MNEMKLYDSKLRHHVATAFGDKIVARYGLEFEIDGYAVVDQHGDVVGTFGEGKFYNLSGELMAVSET